MSEAIDPRVAFAETCRSRARTTVFSFRRDQLYVLARSSDYEAELVQQSRKCIADSIIMVAHTEFLLRRR